MSFKTDFKDEIPANGKRLYQVVDDSTGGIIHNGVRIIRSNKNTQEGDTFGASEVNEIHKMLNDMSNDNLLINGDFQVWQRGTYFGLNQGISSNTFQIYTADRWRIFADTSKKAFKGSIQQVKNGLEVYIMSGADISAFTQMIELNKGLVKELAGKKIAISFKINNPTGATFNISPTISIVNSSGTYDNYTSSVTVKTGTNEYTVVLQMPNSIEFYDTYPYMRFNLWNIGDTLPLRKFEISHIKMEIGSTSTPYTPRSYVDELSMCQRFFQYYADICLEPLAANGIIYLGFPFRTWMRGKPTRNVTSLTNDSKVNIISQISSIALTECGISYLQLTNKHSFIILALSLDAEIYS